MTNQEILAAIIKKTPAGFILFDEKWNLVFTNQSILSHLNVTEDELKGLKWMDFIIKNHKRLNKKNIHRMINFVWRKPVKNKLVKLFLSKEEKYTIFIISTDDIKINQKSFYLFTCKEMTKEHFASVRAVEFHKNYKRQIKMAKRIQKIINNSVTDQIIGKSYIYHFYSTFLPSHDLSGDIINISQINRRYTSVFIGDGRGHGLSSAIYSSLIYSYISLLTSEVTKGETDLIRLAELINQFSHKDFVKGDEYYFFSGVFILIDGDHDEFSIVNAGHPPVFYFSSKNKVKRLHNHGPMFGVSPNSSYQKTEFQSEGDQTFLIFTDGLLEAHGHNYEETGGPISEKEMLEFLSDYSQKRKKIKDLPNSLVEFKKRYHGNHVISDDISILAMHIKSKT